MERGPAERGWIMKISALSCLGCGVVVSGCVREAPPAEMTVLSHDTGAPKFTDSVLPLSGAPVVMPGFDYATRLLVAHRDSAGRACIVSPRAALEVGAPVMLVFADFPQHFVSGRLGPRRKLRCSHPGEPQADSLAYVVEGLDKTAEGSGPAILIVG